MIYDLWSMMVYTLNILFFLIYLKIKFLFSYLLRSRYRCSEAENFDVQIKVYVLQYFVKREEFDDETRKKKKNISKWFSIKTTRQKRWWENITILNWRGAKLFATKLYYTSKVLLNLNYKYSEDYEDGHGLRMLCDNGRDHPISFTSAMRHWRTCPLHSPRPEIFLCFEDGLLSIKKIQKAHV